MTTPAASCPLPDTHGPEHFADIAHRYLDSLRPEGATAMAQPDPLEPTATWLLPETLSAACDPTIGDVPHTNCPGAAQTPGPCHCHECHGRTTPPAAIPLPDLHTRVTEVTVSAIPETNINHGHFSVTVAWRGTDRYAVIRRGYCLGDDGEWDYESIPSERADEWIATHRFSYDEAFQLACKVAPDLTVNGHTVADVLRRAQP